MFCQHCRDGWKFDKEVWGRYRFKRWHVGEGESDTIIPYGMKTVSTAGLMMTLQSINTFTNQIQSDQRNRGCFRHS